MVTAFNRGFTPRTYRATDGLCLFARDYGSENPHTRERLPVICLPGLTRNSRDFHQLALLLSSDPNEPRRVLALDYRGRGSSQWDDSGQSYTLAAEADDVLSAADAFGIERAAFIGTSRGGLTLHLLAGMRPSLLGAVILNDIGPVIERTGLEQIKAYLFRDQRPRGWDDAASMLKGIHGGAFTALADADWHEMAHAIYVEKDGALVADFDPAIAAQLAATDLSQPIPTLWPQFDGFAGIPLMAIRGENSALLSAATLAEMAAWHPLMTKLTAPGQGHAPLLHLGGMPSAIKNFLTGR